MPIGYLAMIMHKLSLLPLALVMAACATPTAPVSTSPNSTNTLDELISPRSASPLFPRGAEAVAATPESLAPRKDDNWVGSSYTTLKVGTFEGAGDLSNQSTGLYSELIFGREIVSFLAIEGVVGYMQANGSVFDIWGIPLFVQARASMPILVVEPYIGIGIGGFYTDISSPNATLQGSDFVAAGNAFIGIEAGLGNISLGIEAKYIVTEEFNSNFTVEGTSVMLSATLPF